MAISIMGLSRYWTRLTMREEARIVVKIKDKLNFGVASSWGRKGGEVWIWSLKRIWS